MRTLAFGHEDIRSNASLRPPLQTLIDVGSFVFEPRQFLQVIDSDLVLVEVSDQIAEGHLAAANVEYFLNEQGVGIEGQMETVQLYGVACWAVPNVHFSHQFHVPS